MIFISDPKIKTATIKYCKIVFNNGLVIFYQDKLKHKILFFYKAGTTHFLNWLSGYNIFSCNPAVVWQCLECIVYIVFKIYHPSPTSPIIHPLFTHSITRRRDLLMYISRRATLVHFKCKRFQRGENAMFFIYIYVA